MGCRTATEKSERTGRRAFVTVCGRRVLERCVGLQWSPPKATKMSPARPKRSRKRCAPSRSLRVETLEKRLLLAVGGLPSQLGLAGTSFWQEYHDSLSESASVDDLQLAVEQPGRLTVWTNVDDMSHLDPFLALHDDAE